MNRFESASLVYIFIAKPYQKNCPEKITNNNEPLFFHQLEHKTISLL